MSAQTGAASARRTVDLAWAPAVGSGILAGVVVGLMVHFGLGVMPIWLSAVGAAEPPVPNLVLQSLIGHAVFDSVLSVAYGVWAE